MKDRKGKKKRKESEEELKFNQLLKRELMKWYYGALYAGGIKPGSAKKSCQSLQQKKCKNL